MFSYIFIKKIHLPLENDNSSNHIINIIPIKVLPRGLAYFVSGFCNTALKGVYALLFLHVNIFILFLLGPYCQKLM